MTTVHPRVRGAHRSATLGVRPMPGPSPRARGSLPEAPALLGRGRSIPACAGLTLCRRRTPGQPTVHPRVRGAHRRPPRNPRPPVGPSPRARGSPWFVWRVLADVRSIPACAGLTRDNPPSVTVCQVHPRVRGAHADTPTIVTCRGGPSPRARGSPITAIISDQRAGPSPRARGSRRRRIRRDPANRSIPACAGLTWPYCPVSRSRAVHPRVRGAHLATVVTMGSPLGPSPRARGSPQMVVGVGGLHRSIPACAGLTTTPSAASACGPVHPRVRGAHRRLEPHQLGALGPSPRARGSQRHRGRSRSSLRSIPACAGLTLTGGRPAAATHGPSPRARGSPLNELQQRGALSPRDLLASSEMAGPGHPLKNPAKSPAPALTSPHTMLS